MFFHGVDELGDDVDESVDDMDESVDDMDEPVDDMDDAEQGGEETGWLGGAGEHSPALGSSEVFAVSSELETNMLRDWVDQSDPEASWSGEGNDTDEVGEYTDDNDTEEPVATLDALSHRSLWVDPGSMAAPATRYHLASAKEVIEAKSMESRRTV
ncbi:hypothetical protein FRB90_009916 [Tulasnella sp. 427]|nr:hypothetical protein FRB90_009916 [Tulasnella sp. 427]